MQKILGYIRIDESNNIKVYPEDNECSNIILEVDNEKFSIHPDTADYIAHLIKISFESCGRESNY